MSAIAKKPLYVDGVRVPEGVIKSGYVAAFTASCSGEVAGGDDVAFCQHCHTSNEFYHDQCRQCGGDKPWLHSDELFPEDVVFGDLEDD